VGLFASLSDGDIKPLAESLAKRIFSEGDVVLNEGDHGVGFYVISEGTVEYSINGERVGSGGPGDYFGEVALIDEGPRAATVTAATDLIVYVMPAWEFRARVEENADIASELGRVMARRRNTQS
jgi:CRP/FNR family cyclic AMP-dependent transcriptional regulator